MTIDLNCDLGESYGVYTLGMDQEVLPLVSSANIACGGHAGDAAVMAHTVALAKQYGTAVGAHPGFLDKEGFGRRHIAMKEEEIYQLCLYQIGALHAFCVAEGVKMQHVKPHGALYNAALRDSDVAKGVVRAVKDFNKDLLLFAPVHTELHAQGEREGLQVVKEIFADRTYTAEGTLTPRTEKKAFIDQPEKAADQVLEVLQKGTVRAVDGTVVAMEADTVCVHGDNEQAVLFIQHLKKQLEHHGTRVQAAGDRI
ncbi:5-oxoprolinase subunit PxpA [Marinococcus halophilus]|uniref:5-oxoprolinase subunit PxpA n=1 Tax=Marinococcus halophilus TaxID=1371 RepID=UPI0009A74DEC|nr:5-oxoprolinase subunit PxpA [Marinococcus halophilus]